MSVLGHIAIGVVTARRITPPCEGRDRLAGRMASLGALALLPDTDLLLHALAPGVALLDHRAATHSLVFAIVVGLIVALSMLAGGHGHAVRWGLMAGAIVASHGLMDMIGNSELGVQLLWPFSDARLLAPWQLLPDPSLTPPLAWNLAGAVVAEAIVFVPAWLYAFIPRRRPRLA